MKDIDGNEIEVGDIVLRPMPSALSKHYVLGYTQNKNGIILSCCRGNSIWDSKAKQYSIVYSPKGSILGKSIEHHNAKQYLRWTPELFIYKKNATIPENLRKFVKMM